MANGSERVHGPDVSKISFEDAWQFIIRVGVAAHGYGSTATRLEAFLEELSKSFGYEGVFRSSPSEIVFGLRESPGLPQRVEVIATPAPAVDLDKLARLGDMLNEVKAGTLSLADAAPRLDAIKRAAPPWGTFAGMLGRAFVALGLAPLLGGGGPIRCCLSCLVYSSAASSCFQRGSGRVQRSGCR